jgi:nitrate/nitrite transporter NarK
MLADRFGGRAVFALLMIIVAVPAYVVPMVLSYRMLLYVAFFLGMAGSSFAVGMGFVSRWFPPERQGGALALCGTLVPGDWDRRLTYSGAALTNAVGTLVLIISNRPAIYFVGAILYLLTNGFVWARFVALLVEVVGAETPDPSTFYSALNAAGAIPLLFMIWLDGFGYSKFGTHGLLWTDAAPNLLVFAIVVTVFLIRGMSLQSSPAPPALTAKTSRL